MRTVVYLRFERKHDETHPRPGFTSTSWFVFIARGLEVAQFFGHSQVRVLSVRVSARLVGFFRALESRCLQIMCSNRKQGKKSRVAAFFGELITKTRVSHVIIVVDRKLSVESLELTALLTEAMKSSPNVDLKLGNRVNGFYVSGGVSTH